MSKYLLVLLVIMVITLFACSQNQMDNNASDNDPFEASPQTASMHKQSETGETESSPPIIRTSILTFASIRTMKDEIDENRNRDPQSSLYSLSNINTSDLKELKGLNTNYAESWVEWSGDKKYVIYYTSADSVLAFTPFASEKMLREEMDNWLLSDGTYENLLANRLVTNVEYAALPSATGISYQCIYNTNIVAGLILRYHTYTDPTTNISYILSETFSPDDQLQTKSLFVFDGDSSFMCTGNDDGLTINTALSFSSSIVE